MSVGTYISGAGHTALVLWMVSGWGMQAEPLPFEFTEISVVSGDEFDALTQGIQPDQPAGAVPELTPPQEVPDAPPPTPVLEAPPTESAAPDPITAPSPETPPQAPDLSVPEAVVTDIAPQAPEVPTLVTPPQSLELGTSARPVPRPAPRVTPDIIAPPPPDATVAPDVAQTAVPDPEAAPADDIEVAEDEAAPEASTDQIVTEAEEPDFADQISLAPTTSARPQSRPNRPAADNQDTSNEDVLAALQEAGAGQVETAPAPTPGAVGGDLSDSQKADLRREIRGCWSVGSASTAALNTLVTVEWLIFPNGTIEASSITLSGFEGGTAADAGIAFDIARRALLRCQSWDGRQGYTIPSDQFQEPRMMRMTFDPSEMRLR